LNQRNNFIYSAHNLQDFVDCPRRFELIYLLKQPWPAVATEPVLEMEEKSNLGMQFHQAAQQMLSGIAADDVVHSLEDHQLMQWITRFAAFLGRLQWDTKLTEITLTMALNGSRILSVLDLLMVTGDGKAIIFDWKTAHKEPNPSFYKERIQSQVYPMVVVESFQQVFPKMNLKPEDLEMVYWFPEFPEKAIHLGYSRAAHQANLIRIAGLISDIARRESGGFEMTHELNRCKYCVYRSLCDRGRTAGIESDESDDVPALDLPDFDQIEEIPY
jgi:hypothetical protein